MRCDLAYTSASIGIGTQDLEYFIHLGRPKRSDTLQGAIDLLRMPAKPVGKFRRLDAGSVAQRLHLEAKQDAARCGVSLLHAREITTMG